MRQNACQDTRLQHSWSSTKFFLLIIHQLNCFFMRSKKQESHREKQSIDI